MIDKSNGPSRIRHKHTHARANAFFRYSNTQHRQLFVEFADVADIRRVEEEAEKAEKEACFVSLAEKEGEGGGEGEGAEGPPTATAAAAAAAARLLVQEAKKHREVRARIMIFE